MRLDSPRTRPGGPDPLGATSFVERIQRYMEKALREAKVHASWVHPNPAYDAAMDRFIAAILDRSAPPPAVGGRLRSLIAAIVPSSGGNPFLADFQAFQERIAGAGTYNSLAQTLLKVALPGVPDTYVLTGQRVEVTTRDGRPSLALETVLDSLPVAFLEVAGEH